jgi:hypothetical protein
MSHFQNSSEIDNVLKALQKNPNNYPTSTIPQELIDMEKTEETSPEEETDFEAEYKKLLKRIGASLDNNSAIMEEAAQLVRMVGDDKTLEAYASVSKSQSDLLKTLSSTISERDKIRTQEKLKKADMALKKELATLKGETGGLITGGSGNTTNIQNNYVIRSSRDEMFDIMFGKEEDKSKAVKKVFGDKPPEVLDAEIVKI